LAAAQTAVRQPFLYARGEGTAGQALPDKDSLFRFKKQGSGQYFACIFRFVKQLQLFFCFFETFSAFLLLSNLPETFIIVKRKRYGATPVRLCKKESRKRPQPF